MFVCLMFAHQTESTTTFETVISWTDGLRFFFASSEVCPCTSGPAESLLQQKEIQKENPVGTVR